ncbi:MAG TPA: NAD(P)-dependent oxidoreductase [Hyphomicrobiales bacterium]|nr:NAD(P)-dependent oxidoreductase [Hyphomicrobiales bacterium]
MFQGSYDRVRARLPSGVPFEVVTIDAGRTCRLGGREMDLEVVKPDVVWLSLDAAQAGVFEPLAAAARSPGVGWMQTFLAGLDDPGHIAILESVGRLTRSDAQAPAVAQFAVAAVLSEWTGFEGWRVNQAHRNWVRRPFRELDGSRWLVVGFGRIGHEIARRVRAFGAAVIAVRRAAEPDVEADEVVTPEALSAYLPAADVVVLACPLTAQTRYLADAGFFRAMKPRATFVNISRGALVCEADLLAALDSGTPEVAILDVCETEPPPPDSPLWSHAAVRLSPHNAGLGGRVMARGDDLFLENLARLLAGEPLRNLVTSSGQPLS